MNKTTISKQLYRYGDQNLQYTLVRSRRRKTSEIIVDDNEIIIRTPFSKSIAEIESLVNNKIGWIIEKQNDFRARRSILARPTFAEGSSLPYLGRKYEIEIISATNNIDKIDFNRKFSVTLRVSRENHEKLNSRIKSLYEDWLYSRAKKIFSKKVKHFSKVIGVNPKKIVIKNLKNRWGSIAKNETMNLNVNLLKAPEDVIDYIIIHELSHLIIKGHSHKFWIYIHKFIPDYEDRVNWLTINGPNILSN